MRWETGREKDHCDLIMLEESQENAEYYHFPPKTMCSCPSYTSEDCWKLQGSEVKTYSEPQQCLLLFMWIQESYFMWASIVYKGMNFPPPIWLTNMSNHIG